MDCDFPDARNQAVDAFRGGYYSHFSQIQLSLSAADLIRRHVLCNCKALKLEEQQFLGEASCTLSEIATKVDGTSTLNLALEGVPSPAHTHHSGQLTIYAEESVALGTTAAETGEKLSILMSAGQNHQDKIQLLVDKYSENNQHTCLDLNPMVAVDITGCPNEHQRVRCIPSENCNKSRWNLNLKSSS